MTTTRYYSTQRPVAPGTYPKRGAVNIVNFDERRYVDEIYREAWGYVEYDHELDDVLADDYELVKPETTSPCGFISARLGSVATVMGCKSLDMLEARSTVSRTALDRWFFQHEDPTEYGLMKIADAFGIHAGLMRVMCSAETPTGTFEVYLDALRSTAK